MSNFNYIQYGCGLTAPLGWQNFDASPTLRLQKLPLIGEILARKRVRFPANVDYGDIVRGLPVATGSADGVYCSHVLEHLSLEDFRIALANTFSILREGGIFRLVMPDLEYEVVRYQQNTSSDASIEFIKSTLLGEEARPRSLLDFATRWLGNSRHLWLWDYKSVEQELHHAGFRGIRRAQYGDSTDSIFLEVEERGRWENCLGVECVK